MGKWERLALERSSSVAAQLMMMMVMKGLYEVNISLIIYLSKYLFILPSIGQDSEAKKKEQMLKSLRYLFHHWNMTILSPQQLEFKTVHILDPAQRAECSSHDLMAAP